MTILLISTETETWQTEAADPDDKWSRDSTDGRVVNVWASVSDDPNSDTRYWNDSYARELNGVGPGDTIYAVVADYSTGDTFGRDGGHAQVLEIFTDPDEAAKFAAVAGQPTPSKRSWDRNYDYEFTYEGKQYRRAWAGYFEYLNSLDVWEIRVRGTVQTPLTADDSRSYGFKVGR